MIYLVIGVIFMMFGLFRFTIYRNHFKKSFIIMGFTFTPEIVSILLFVIGLVLVLLFLVNFIQPLFYQGRDLHPGITYLEHSLYQFIHFT
jgi:hypothetical protein